MYIMHSTNDVPIKTDIQTFKSSVISTQPQKFQFPQIYNYKRGSRLRIRPILLSFAGEVTAPQSHLPRAFYMTGTFLNSRSNTQDSSSGNSNRLLIGVCDASRSNKETVRCSVGTVSNFDLILDKMDLSPFEISYELTAPSSADDADTGLTFIVSFQIDIYE